MRVSGLPQLVENHRKGRRPLHPGARQVVRPMVSPNRCRQKLGERFRPAGRPIPPLPRPDDCEHGGDLCLKVGHRFQARRPSVIDEAHKLSYDDTLTELIREARKYGVGILLASQSVKDFDRIVFDMVGTKVALQLEGDDAKVMAENLGLTDKNDRDMARSLILHQPPFRGLMPGQPLASSERMTPRPH